MNLTKIKIPNTYIIILAIAVLVAVMTWIVPSGSYERSIVNGREVVQPNSYQRVDSNPQGFAALLTAPIKGFVDAAHIIGFVLLVGGAFSVLQRTRAIDAGILAVARAHDRIRLVRLLTIPIFMVMFSLGGAFFGMSEETIPFVLIFIPLALSLGYDSITGVAIVYIGAHVGFAAAFFNPFTVGIAQGIAEVDIFSGLEYRVLCWALFTVTAILFVMAYARRVKNNPAISPVREIDAARQSRLELEGTDDGLAMSRRHAAVLLTFGAGMLVMAYGVIRHEWYIDEISAVFIAVGIAVGIVGRLSADEITHAFVDGAKALVGTALIIGLARGILILARDGRIIDTVLAALASTIDDVPGVVSVQVMFLVQSALNFFVPSGSGQAALTMPIMAPLSDLLGLTRQTAVLAFQFGDGFSNMFWPTAPVLLGALSLADIPWEKWARWILPLQFIFLLLGFLLLIPPVLMHWQ